MRGAGKPVYAYYEAERFYGESESPGVYAARVAKYYKLDQRICGWTLTDSLSRVSPWPTIS